MREAVVRGETQLMVLGVSGRLCCYWAVVQIASEEGWMRRNGGDRELWHIVDQGVDTWK